MSKYSITGSAQEMGLHVRGYAKPRDSARSINTIGWCGTIIIGRCHQVAQRTSFETNALLDERYRYGCIEVFASKFLLWVLCWPETQAAWAYNPVGINRARH
jgi:hypothetical protein